MARTKTNSPWGTAWKFAKRALGHMNPLGDITSLFWKNKMSKKGIKMKPGRTKKMAKLLREVRKSHKKAYGTKAYRPKKSSHGGATYGDGGGNERMSFSHGKRVGKLGSALEHKVRVALNPLNTYVQQANTQIVQSQGLCTYQVFEMGTTSDLFSLNASPIGAGYNGIVNSKNGRVYIDSMDQTITLTNADSATVNMRIYEFMYRRDLPVSYSNTQAIVQSGFTAQSSTSAPITYTNQAGTLFMNSLFTAYCKISKVRVVELAGGKTLVLSQSHKTGKRLNPVIEDVSNTWSIPHYTRGFVIQAWGQVVNGTALQSGVCSTARVKVDCIVDRRYIFNQPFSAVGNTYYVSDLPLLAVQNEINQDSGVVQQDQQA